MDTLDFILKRYAIELPNDNMPVQIPHGRWREMGPLFRDLGFKKGAEIGVYKGHFTKALCERFPGVELVGVDAWTVYGDYREYETNDLEKQSFQEAVERNKKYNVRFIKAFSMDAVKEFADESLDFVFIDANHDFEHVAEDIAGWSKKVRSGGIVCGHDYLKTKNHDFGVIEAVNSWCNTHDVKPLFLWKDRCPSWMYVKC